MQDSAGLYAGRLTAPICPTQPPVASFTASATTVCVGQSVTFTDTSTNIPGAWIWNLPGGTPNTSTAQNPTVVYNTAGTYTVTLQAFNYNGNNTVTMTNYITVTAVPTILTTTPASRCDVGTVTLQATASAGTLNWYDAPTLGNLVGTGTSFTTPSISISTTYYVETVVGACMSARTAVTATVNTTPSLTGTTPAARCGTGNISLTATAASGTIRWYDLPSNGTLLATGGTLSLLGLSATTTYYVEVTNGACTSPRTAVTATINPVPTITSTTSASRCDTGTLTLQAVASGGTINWYDAPTLGNLVGTGTSFTTPSISSSTTYYVETTSGICNSPRTAVTATVNSTPTITSTSPNSRCDAGTVTLTAGASGGTVNWYDAPTLGNLVGSGNSFTTPSISVTTTYYVGATSGTCSSPRTAVIATVNTSPTITSTTPMSICSGDSFTISATASAGTLNWYNGVGGLLATGSSYSAGSLSSTTIFYVQASTASCTSVLTPVQVTVTNRPTITSSTPASRCGNGTLTLTAAFTSGTINWYDAPTLGNLVGTGSSFVTPVLSATTVYYVEATNGSCTSTVRTAVSATVNQQPVLLSSTPASRCGNGTVTLLATASIGTINWYNAPTGGTLMATGGSFTTPVLTVTTPYYVEVVNGTCSTARTLVTATVSAVATVTSTTPASRCSAGTVTLIAASNIGTLNWYDAPTLGNLVGTGTTFTTPSIAVSTTYYVEATNGSCTSGRTAVTASITPTAAPLGNANQTFCTGETVGMIVVTGSNIVWYNAPTNGTVIPPGTPLVSGNIYYASQTVGSCESQTRLAVTMTSGACLGNEEFEANVIKVYPNPVIDMLTISSTETITKVEVLNLLGQTIFTATVNDLETAIDMSRYATATYIVRVLSEDNKVKIIKVIKK